MNNEQMKKELETLWIEILGNKNFSPNDDFFDIGGTSLSMIKLLEVTKKKYDVDINIVEFSEGLNLNIYTELLTNKLK